MIGSQNLPSSNSRSCLFLYPQPCIITAVLYCLLPTDHVTPTTKIIKNWRLNNKNYSVTISGCFVSFWGKVLSNLKFNLENVCSILAQPKTNYTILPKFLGHFQQFLKNKTLTKIKHFSKITCENEFFSNLLQKK